MALISCKPRDSAGLSCAETATQWNATSSVASARRLLPYAETDTLCYRADPDEPLYRRQQQLWEPLLLQADGRTWGTEEGAEVSKDYRDDVREIVRAIGLDPDKVTLYSLRHSSIVRALLAGIPIRIVAAAHDTSVAMIEATYSKFITEHSDALTRRALLHHDVPTTTGDNVVALPTSQKKSEPASELASGFTSA